MIASLLFDFGRYASICNYRPFSVDWETGDFSIYEGATPTIVFGDIGVVSRTTSGGYTATLQADGTVIFDLLGDGSRQTYQVNVYDVSVQAWYEPALITNYLNDLPITVIEEGTSVFYFPLNVAITAFDLESFFSEPEGDAYVITADALTTGLSIVANELVGTPTVQEIRTTTFTATDPAGNATTFGVQFVIGSVTVPDVDDPGTTQAEALGALYAVNLGISVTTAYSSTVPAGEVISQSPAPGTLVAPSSIVSIVVSLGLLATDKILFSATNFRIRFHADH